MFDLQSQDQLRQAILEGDRDLLNQLRADVRPLKSRVRRIQPRTATSLSLVATDGGNNALRFDPFLVQIVRVVDSSNNGYCLEALTPTTDLRAVNARQFYSDGRPRTALGEMMEFLGVRSLSELSPMVRAGRDGKPLSYGWVKAYRELVEWAILLAIRRKKDFATDALVRIWQEGT